jgi:GntR family transcriptional regulator
VVSASGTARPGGVAQAVTDRLRAWIEHGRYAASGRLPGERALAEQLAVSRGTVRHALTALASAGLITPAPQSGWYIAGPPLGEPPHTLLSFTEMARRRGIEPRTSVLAQQARAATLDEAEQLRLPPTSPVLALDRVRRLAEVAVCLDHSLIALARVPGLDSADLTDRSLYSEMEARGVRPARSDFSVQACGADEAVVQALGVAVGEPVLVGTELCSDPAGVPLLLGRSTFRGDAYRFHATLFRD